MKENYISFTKIDIKDIEAQHFATFLNFKTIPILITKEGKNIKIINGDRDIIEAYKKNNSSGNDVVIEESVSINSTFSAVEEEGCGFASLKKLTEESDCDSK